MILPAHPAPATSLLHLYLTRRLTLPLSSLLFTPRSFPTRKRRPGLLSQLLAPFPHANAGQVCSLSSSLNGSSQKAELAAVMRPTTRPPPHWYITKSSRMKTRRAAKQPLPQQPNAGATKVKSGRTRVKSGRTESGGTRVQQRRAAEATEKSNREEQPKQQRRATEKSNREEQEQVFLGISQ